MNCVHCGGESDLSICTILSIRKTKPRVQRASKAVALCGACIRNAKIPHKAHAYASVIKALQAAYTDVYAKL